MRFHGEARRDRYDAIVVGAGMGGLTAAALLARGGRDVLVIERHDRVGGYAHAFRRGRHLFDSAVHLVGGCEEVSFEGGGVVHRLLSALGVRDRCEFKRVDPLYEVRFPGGALRAPSDMEEFVRVHCADRVAEAKGLRQFLQECLNARRETRLAEELSNPFEVVKTPDRFPTLMRYRRATVAQVLDAHVDAPRTKAFASALWPYMGLPPSRGSFLYFAGMLMSYLADGAFYCVGSFQRMADALAYAIESSGGEVLLKSPVRRILVDEGRAVGVILENGQSISAPVVISNADARQTVEELVGSDGLPRRYVASLRGMRPSLSAFVAYLVTDLPLGQRDLCHETFLYDSWDHDASHASSREGAPSWLTLTAPTLADPGLAPDGEHVLTLTTLVAAGDGAMWKRDKERTLWRLVDAADRHVPGLRDRIRFAEGATPRTMERYTRNTDGAIYGWELSPGQIGPGRPTIGTPIAGLYLAGHWTQPGGGVYGVVSSGVQAARRILGFPGESQLWRSFSTAGE